MSNMRKEPSELWQQALLFVLRRLDVEEIAYKVVGGTSVLLHEVPSVLLFLTM